MSNKEYKDKPIENHLLKCNWEEECQQYIIIYEYLADFYDRMQKKKCFSNKQLYSIMYKRITAVYKEVDYLFPFETSVILNPNNSQETTVKRYMYEFKKTVEQVKDLLREERQNLDRYYYGIMPVL